jgi:hypothetical protein
MFHESKTSIQIFVFFVNEKLWKTRTNILCCKLTTNNPSNYKGDVWKDCDGGENVRERVRGWVRRWQAGQGDRFPRRFTGPTSCLQYWQLPSSRVTFEVSLGRGPDFSGTHTWNEKKKSMALGENVWEQVSARQWKGRGIDGRVSPRTGASERVVLVHRTGTRPDRAWWGNVCTCLFRRMCLLVGPGEGSSNNVGHIPVWVVVRSLFPCGGN